VKGGAARCSARSSTGARTWAGLCQAATAAPRCAGCPVVLATRGLAKNSASPGRAAAQPTREPDLGQASLDGSPYGDPQPARPCARASGPGLRQAQTVHRTVCVQAQLLAAAHAARHRPAQVLGGDGGAPPARMPPWLVQGCGWALVAANIETPEKHSGCGRAPSGALRELIYRGCLSGTNAVSAASSGAPSMGAILGVKVPGRAGHSKASEAQLREGDRAWGGSVKRKS
jgi:hypothetical protein